MKTAIHALTFGVTATTAIEPHRFVDYDGNHCAAAEKAQAVSHAQGAEAGEECPLALGIVLVELGATVAKGAGVESDSVGRAVTLSAGVDNGTVLDGGDIGDIVRLKNI